MTFLSIKKTLSYVISQFLSRRYEARSLAFTYLSQDPSHLSLAHISSGVEASIDKKRGTQEVLYISAIAHLIYRELKVADNSAVSNLTLLDISNRVVSLLESDKKNAKTKLINSKKRHSSCELDHKDVDYFANFQLWEKFVIETSRPGWLGFYLPKSELINWLDRLDAQLSDFIAHYVDTAQTDSVNQTPHQTPILLSASLSSPKPTKDSRVWQAQYTYGRCCSLLRQWNAQVDQPYRVTNDTAFFSQHVLTAWNSSPESEDSWVTQYPVVHHLIELIDLVECDLFWIPYRYPSEQYFLLLKSVSQMCQSFELFLSSYIAGYASLSAQSPPKEKQRFQAYFTLVSIVQKTLRILLSRCLGVHAPEIL